MPRPSATHAPEASGAGRCPASTASPTSSRSSAHKRDVLLKLALEDSAELVRFKPGHIELHVLPNAPKDLANDLGRKLKFWTGERWMISLTEERGETPLGDVRREREARMLEEARRHPSVQSVLRHFPEAEITAVRDLSAGDERTKKD